MDDEAAPAPGAARTVRVAQVVQRIVRERDVYATGRIQRGVERGRDHAARVDGLEHPVHRLASRVRQGRFAEVVEHQVERARPVDEQDRVVAGGVAREAVVRATDRRARPGRGPRRSHGVLKSAGSRVDDVDLPGGRDGHTRGAAAGADGGDRPADAVRLGVHDLVVPAREHDVRATRSLQPTECGLVDDRAVCVAADPGGCGVGAPSGRAPLGIVVLGLALLLLRRRRNDSSGGEPADASRSPFQRKRAVR